jgi:hypothetical protein
MHFPHLWHHPGFFKVTCTWSWGICEINLAILVKRRVHLPDDTSSFPEDDSLPISFVFFLSKVGLLHARCFPQVLKTMLLSTSRSSHALLSFGILRLCWFWCIPIFRLLKSHVYCDVTPGPVAKCYPNSGGAKFLRLEGQQVQAVLFDCLILNVVELRFSETSVSPVETAWHHNACENYKSRILPLISVFFPVQWMTCVLFFYTVGLLQANLSFVAFGSEHGVNRIKTDK